MTPLNRALAELEDAEWQLQHVESGVAKGHVPAHALATAQWWVEQCRKQVEELSGEGSSDAS